MYYSGTGNSRYVGEKVSKSIGCSLINLNVLIREKKKTEITDEDLVLVTPTYAWRIPRIVENHLLNEDLSNVRRIWFLMTCGDEIGEASRYNRALCQKLNIEYMGSGQINMPENYIAMFEVPDREGSLKIIAKADEKIEEFSQRIAEGRKLDDNRITLSDRIKSRLVNPVFYRLYVKADGFHVKDDCIGCGICVNRCPLNNIHLEDGKPVWGNSCTHCMGCICYCPKEAIEYGNASKGKFRYHIEALEKE